MMTEGDETLQFPRKLRQTRSFIAEPVSDADIAAILETMRWTGSASDMMHWERFGQPKPS